MRIAINISLSIVLIGLIFIIYVFQHDFTQPHVQWMPGMYRFVAYKPQSKYPMYAQNKIIEASVAGSIVRGFEPLEYGHSKEEATRAGKELQNPYTDADTVIARGATVFAAMCAPCHGSGGNGDGIISKKGFPPPPSLFAQNSISMNGGQIFHIITYGQQNMPSLKNQINREDRWRVITYIRSLQSDKKQHSPK